MFPHNLARQENVDTADRERVKQRLPLQILLPVAPPRSGLLFRLPLCAFSSNVSFGSVPAKGLQPSSGILIRKWIAFSLSVCF